LEQAFTTEKNFLGQVRHFCPDCTVKRQGRSLLVSIALILSCAVFTFLARPPFFPASLPFEMLLSILAILPLVMIHELAHAAVAEALGLRVFAIMIGMGKRLWSGEFLDMSWSVHQLPLGGATLVGSRPTPNIRWKLFFVYLAGPASHALLFFIFLFAMGLVPSDSLEYRLSKVLAIMNFLSLAMNLIPQQVATPSGMAGTDGWQLTHALSLTEAELNTRYVHYYALEAMRAYQKRDLKSARRWVQQALTLDPDSTAVMNVLGVIQLTSGDHHAARQTFLQLLSTPGASQPGMRYILLNNVAYLDVILGDPSLLPEADQFSAEAVQNVPWEPSFLGTRGAVLAAFGKLEEGSDLLKKSISLHADPKNKALSVCHLALIEIQRGNPAQARKLLSTARSFDAKCFLIPRVEARLGKREG
jgi:Flp pilus assembly protein TadD